MARRELAMGRGGGAFGRSDSPAACGNWVQGGVRESGRDEVPVIGTRSHRGMATWRGVRAGDTATAAPAWRLLALFAVRITPSGCL